MEAIWRWRRDSNPRYALNIYSLSRGAPSATRPLHHKLLHWIFLSWLINAPRSRFASKLTLLVSSRSPFGRPRFRSCQPLGHFTINCYSGIFIFVDKRSQVARCCEAFASCLFEIALWAPKIEILSATRPLHRKTLYSGVCIYFHWFYINLIKQKPNP